MSIEISHKNMDSDRLWALLTLVVRQLGDLADEIAQLGAVLSSDDSIRESENHVRAMQSFDRLSQRVAAQARILTAVKDHLLGGDMSTVVTEAMPHLPFHDLRHLVARALGEVRGETAEEQAEDEGNIDWLS
jgi:hypothetical protein